MSDSNRYRRLGERLQSIRNAGLVRGLNPVRMSGPTTGFDSDGRELQVFSSNDYLGLAHHPDVTKAWRESPGFGTGSARLIAGDRPGHHALEDALSEKFGRPATLFSSGWHANLALLGTVLRPEDKVASDQSNHASIIDGIRLSRAEKEILVHGCPEPGPGTRLVVHEGIYSMDGDVLDLAKAAGLARESSAWWMVDEAHAVGVLGPGGRGAAAAAGVEPDFLVGTLGKAFGSFGAFVIGPPELRELLISQGRSFVFTTGLPEAAARAALVSLSLANDARRERLTSRVARLRRGLDSLGFRSLGHHHIIPIILGDRTMDMAHHLLRSGYLVPGIRAPTVPSGTERIRITVSSEHSDQQIDGLLDALDKGRSHIDGTSRSGDR